MSELMSKETSLDRVCPNGSYIADIQPRLQTSLPDWYPALSGSTASVSYVEKREFQWSRHLIFKINDGHGDDGEGILAKILLSRDSGGHVQGAVRPEKDALELEYRALVLLYEHLGSGELGGVTAVRPLAIFPDINVLILDYLPGRNLLNLILAAARPWAKQSVVQSAINAACHGGRLLGTIHQIRRASYPSKEIFDWEDYCQRMDEKVEVLSARVVGDNVRKRLFRLRQTVRELISHLREEITVSFLHYDLYPENLVQLPNGRVYTVDTTLHQVGVVEEDVAKFLVGVDTLKQRVLAGSLVIRSSTLEAIKRSFLDEYSTHVQTSPRILLLYMLLAAVQRWIEILVTLVWKAPTVVATAIQQTRISPYMLAVVDSVSVNLEREFGVR